MTDIRVFYTKLSRAKYISHLDITRCMQRAIKRAEIPVWYTEGFNPHIYITFSLPLSLGYESKSEIMDMRIVEDMSFDEIKERLNSVLPPDIRVCRVDIQRHDPVEIETALYKIELAVADKNGNILSPEIVSDKFTEFIQSETIEVEKKTKKGFKTIDIKPFCELVGTGAVSEKQAAELSVKLSAGNTQNINPSLLLNEFYKRYELTEKYCGVCREAVYIKDGELFA